MTLARCPAISAVKSCCLGTQTVKISAGSYSDSQEINLLHYDARFSFIRVDFSLILKLIHHGIRFMLRLVMDVSALGDECIRYKVQWQKSLTNFRIFFSPGSMFAVCRSTFNMFWWQIYETSIALKFYFLFFNSHITGQPRPKCRQLIRMSGHYYPVLSCTDTQALQSIFNYDNFQRYSD